MNGILNIYKEKDFTSHDVVAKLRGILRQKKIGHTGTLDPQATGVLPVCLGKATKLCDVIGDWDKSYKATLLLGTQTDTEDIFGKVTDQKRVQVTKEEIIEIIHSFEGDYAQIPPMYSAKKIKGKKLYELAREGIIIERKAANVKIHAVRILEVNLPYVVFEVDCSKGTYIRSLCRDIGEKAGCGGCMAALERIRVADFSMDKAYTLSEIETLRDQDQLTKAIRPIDDVFKTYPELPVGDSGQKALKNGNQLQIDMCQPVEKAEYYRVYNSQRQFIGLYSYDKAKNQYKPYKLFFDID